MLNGRVHVWPPVARRDRGERFVEAAVAGQWVVVRRVQDGEARQAGNDDTAALQ